MADPESNAISTKRAESAAATPATAGRYQKRRLLVVAIAVAGIGIGVWAAFRPSTVQLPEGVTRDEYSLATRDFERRYGRRPDRFDVLSWLGDVFYRKKRYAVAVECYREIPSEHESYGATARFQHGEALLKLDRAVEAERQFRIVERLAEQRGGITQEMRSAARDRLRYILEVQLRFEERRQILQANIAIGRFDQLDLMKYCFPGLLRWNGPQAVGWLEAFHAKDPNDFQIRVALGRFRTGQGRLKEALAILKKCRRERPQDLSASAALLECRTEQGRTDLVDAILNELAPPAKSDPWLLLQLRGQAHIRRREYEQAIRCFTFARRTDPANARSCLGLARAYGGLKQTVMQKKFLEYASVFARIQNRTGRIQGTNDLEVYLEVARLCEQVEAGKIALLWAWWARRQYPKSRDAADLFSRLHRLHPDAFLPETESTR